MTNSQLLNVSYKHPSSFWSFADNTLTLIQESVLTVGSTSLTTLAEKAVVSVLQNITVGRLRIITNERIYEFPERVTGPGKGNEPHAELRVINDAFWVRLCMMGDLGFAEAYMFGDVICEDLIPIFLVFLENKQNLTTLKSTVSWLFSLPQRLTSFRYLNSLGNARFNVSAHYDLSDSVFKAFLSKDMTYSCAIFSDLDGDIQERRQSRNVKMTRLLPPTPPSEPEDTGSDSDMSTSHTRLIYPTPSLVDTLETAQQRKLAHIVGRARIFPGHRVLEIGSGWGSLSFYMARHIPGVQIDTITLSDNQCSHVRKEIARQGFGDCIRVHLMDYREMPQEWEHSFDRVVSIEMVEAVGLENIDVYWAAIDRVLKTDSAGGVIQGTTIPEARFSDYTQKIDFIQKWVSTPLHYLVIFNKPLHATPVSSFTNPVFPGALIPTVTLLVSSLERATSGRLIVDSITNIGSHYTRTLREWRRRFVDNFAEIEQALREEHPDFFDSEQGDRSAHEVSVFRRKWIYYFCYCEVGFAKRLLGDHIIAFTREGHEEMGYDVFE